MSPQTLPAASPTRSQLIRLSREESAPRWSWTRLTWPAAAVAAGGAVLGFLQPWDSVHSEPAHSVHERTNAARAVNVELPSPAETSNITLPATIRPWQTTTLHSRVTGYLTAWHVDLGAKVKAGDVLAELETPELDQEVAEGVAQAAEATAAAVQAQAERAEAEAELSVALAQLARVQSEVELARTQLARREKLVYRHAIAQEEFDTFEKQFEARTADVAAAEADVARRRTSLQTRAAVIAARQATAQSRQANVERLKELQGFKRIVAPFSGVVTRRSAEVGMLVTAGTEPLYVVEDMSRVRVQVSVPQSNATRIRVGVPATVSLPESTGKATPASVTRISSSIDSTNRTMLAEIELENSSVGLQPGSYVQVTLSAPQQNTGWTIPANTLQMRIDGPHVAVVGSNGQLELRSVKLGRDLGGRVQVLDGIQGDEQLVVNPTDDLVSGSQVEVKSKPEVAQR
ncbi:Multidrug resistance protein MdtA precursor [Anatilimnocola aggregata]|uniref:Multidrug resistance protein MdtA n=1 Tax=Anatilimnocola aggregata TaxID=2528021 RepID=A0A517Y8B0_9BACT|nr:efflux RND transporter periplasmic adaptor subunit [Anatilimnocola aggregata]QDU26489.1 Multidrug resistance protein MdtA precursor [Anatilimnocola aggregata]